MKKIRRAWVSDYGLYGIFGYPLEHTFSPAMQNAAFRALSVNGFYVPLPVPPERFRALRKYLRKTPLDGFNLTVPHKEIVLGVLDLIDPEAKRIGAVNTVVCKRRVSGTHHTGAPAKLVGYNTDAHGFLEALKRHSTIRISGQSTLILGAGGAARACVYALLNAGARRIILANRTAANAQKIKRDFARFLKTDIIEVMTLSDLARPGAREKLSDVGLVVNATSLGLKARDPSPFNLKVLPKKKILVVDLIYNPPVTKLLREAERLGYDTMNGLPMLLYQGARAFELWTGRAAPLDVMDKALKQASAAA